MVGVEGVSLGVLLGPRPHWGTSPQLGRKSPRFPRIKTQNTQENPTKTDFNDYLQDLYKKMVPRACTLVYYDPR